jgi:hypothetical protein
MAIVLVGAGARAAVVDKGTIGCGITRTETLIATDTHQFGFDAAAGDRVLVAAAGAGFQPSITLTGPGGSVALDGSLADCFGVCVSDTLAAGAHLIHVNSATGTYNITLEATTGSLDGVLCAGTQPLGCGQTRSGVADGATFDVLADADAYTFDATGGEGVSISVWPTNGSLPNLVMSLFDPDGQPLMLDNLSNFLDGEVCGIGVCTLENFVLSQPGPYTLILWDYQLNQIGDYNVTLEATTGSLNGAACLGLPLTCGQTRSGALEGAFIDVLGDTDTFTFDAVGDEAAAVTVWGSTGIVPNLVMRVFDPNGQPLQLNNLDDFIEGPTCGSGVCASESFMPGASGTYTVLAWDFQNNQTGSYDITLEATTGTLNASACTSATALACGVTLSGALDGANFDLRGDTDTFTFDAIGGEAVAVTVWPSAGLSPNPVLTLFDPNGQELVLDNLTGFFEGERCGSGVCASGIFTPGADGTYTALVWDFEHNQLGDYNITLEALTESLDGLSNRPPSPICGTPPLLCGDSLLDQIDEVADANTFNFEAEGGEEVAIRTQPLTGSLVDPVIGLFGPTGEIILNDPNGVPVANSCAGQCFSTPLPADGVYTVLAWDLGLTETGQYSSLFNGCTLPIDPMDTYLRVSPPDTAGDAAPISLASRGIAPGEVIALRRVGDFVDTTGGPDTSTELCGIFSASDTLDVQSALNRVTDALDPPDGMVCFTAPTASASLPTNVPEDFVISEPGASHSEVKLVTVPDLATHLFMAVPDEAYADNMDPDSDLGVSVIPEPPIPALFWTGAAAISALAAHRRQASRRARFRP